LIGSGYQKAGRPAHYARIAFFALAAIGSASLKALKVINRAYLLLPLRLEGSFGSKWKHPMAIALMENQ
jgi:hypothetical protein